MSAENSIFLLCRTANIWRYQVDIDEEVFVCTIILASIAPDITKSNRILYLLDILVYVMDV